jgi:hypothetical protein
MHEPLYTSDLRPARFRATFSKFPTHIEQLETEQAVFRVWLRRQRFRHFCTSVSTLWPIAAGLLLGLLAPRMCALMIRFEPWAMCFVFPFVVIARRPELHALARIAGNLPLLILYAQFPIEGLLARLAFRRRVTVRGVACQVCYFHYLAALQLLMIGGAVAQGIVR